jgi:DNA polymerase I-like protein with 3'-5' exonuclease and polymerase domains
MITYFGRNELTEELYSDHILNPRSIVAVDAETISLEDRQVLGFSIATTPHDAFWFHPNDPEAKDAMKILKDKKIKKVFHNALFDLSVMPEIDRTNISDTNIMARLLGHTETKLAVLLEDTPLSTTPAGEMLGKGQTMADLPDIDVAKHCCEDTRGTMFLYHDYIHQVDRNYYQIELDVIPVLLDMSARGMKINQEDLTKLEQEYEEEVALYGEMLESVGVKPTSNQQIGMFLAYRKNFLPLTKTRKQFRVDKDALEFLDDPWAQVVLKFRENNKVLTTYIRPLKDQDRMYFELGMETGVGRLNSHDRNIQNIPPETRHIFMPDSGTYTTGDYSQEHLRILMHMSGDKNMRRIYEEGDFGGDLHQFTAEKMGITRRVGRNVNYSIVYGGTPSVVSQYTKIKDRKRCQDWIDGWFRTFPDAAEWIKHAQRVGLEEGWSLPTLFGRRIKIPEEYLDGMKNKSVNYPILGSDGEVIKRALLICKKHGLPLAVTVHDSITLDGDCEFPIEEIENVHSDIRLPFEVKKTLRWE